MNSFEETSAWKTSLVLFYAGAVEAGLAVVAIIKSKYEYQLTVIGTMVLVRSLRIITTLCHSN